MSNMTSIRNTKSENGCLWGSNHTSWATLTPKLEKPIQRTYCIREGREILGGRVVCVKRRRWARPLCARNTARSKVQVLVGWARGCVWAVCAVRQHATSYTDTPPASRGHAIPKDCEEEDIMHQGVLLSEPTRVYDSHGGCHWDKPVGWFLWT